MNEAAKSLAQMKKANKLVRLAFRKNGPKSFKRGQGALLQALLVDDGATQRDLTKTLGMNRSNLKDIVKKAERNGYVTIESCLSAEEVAQLDAITEKLILAMKDKGICGKKKGYKVRRKRHRR